MNSQYLKEFLDGYVSQELLTDKALRYSVIRTLDLNQFKTKEDWENLAKVFHIFVATDDFCALQLFNQIAAGTDDTSLKIIFPLIKNKLFEILTKKGFLSFEIVNRATKGESYDNLLPEYGYIR